MKKFLFLVITISLSTSILAAGNTLTAKATPAATATPTAENIIDKTFHSLGSKTKIAFDLKAEYKKDLNGVIFNNVFSMNARQTLIDGFSAEANIIFKKALSNENTSFVLELTTARFQYVNTFFNVTVGRTDLSSNLSTLSYFGPYTTAGIRYVDVVYVTFPFFLIAGIPELEQIDLPPLALSFYYAPTLFTKAHTAYDADQALYIGQVRANMNFLDIPTQIMVNIGKNGIEYFILSILNGGFSLETSVSFDLFKHYKINADFGVQNLDKFQKTAAISAGLELHDFRQWLFAIDRVLFETQVPLDPDNQVNNWFLSLENKIGSFRYGLACTNSTNRFSLLDINFNTPPAEPYGQPLVYTKENLSFINDNPDNVFFYGYIGYGF